MEDRKFILKSEYQPTGDQPEAIRALTEGILAGERAETKQNDGDEAAGGFYEKRGQYFSSFFFVLGEFSFFSFF